MQKIYSYFYYISILLIYSLTTAQKHPVDTLKIMFVGDIMNHGPQLRAAYNSSTGEYDFSGNFTYVQPVFSKAHMVVGNLETPVGLKPYAGYPQFSAPPALVTACKQAGIGVLATANNHACDKRKKGIIATLDVLDSLQVYHLGTYRNQREKDSLTPLLVPVAGVQVALLNYTYGTNGLPVPYPTKVNLIDKQKIKEDIAKAKAKNPDILMVFLHWGEQYHNKPDKAQKELAAFIRGQGVDLIIGSHPHVIQAVDYEMDVLNNRTYLTAYSLGNFISNQRTAPRDGSMILSLNLTRNSQGNWQVAGYETIPIWVYKYQKDKKWHYEILPVEDFKLQPEYFTQNADYQKMMRYYKHYQQLMKP